MDAKDDTEKRRQFAITLAKASWLSPCIAILMNVWASNAFANNTFVHDDAAATEVRLAHLVIGLTSLALHFTGFCCGVVALFKMREFGPKGIRTQAIVGTLLSGFITLIFVLAIAALLMH